MHHAMVVVTCCVCSCRHVQLMMVRRQLASLGIELTDEEAALLTREVC
jgi:hypothetical protein